MSYSTSLQTRHQQLEQSIMDEQKRPLPDGLRLQHLKKEKLRVKEAMSRL
ncbi:MAG: YdcH family protein [Alphaproteobacteria bacterium]